MIPTSLVGQATVPEINAALQNNLAPVVKTGSWFDVKCPSAGSVVVVPHDLNEIPTHIYVMPYQDSRWWVDSDDRKMWDKSKVVFHATDGVFSVMAALR